MGTLDLTDNPLILDYTAGTSPASSLRSALHSARATGDWSGRGLTSANATADPTHTTALAYAEASTLLSLTGTATTTWSGQPVDPTSLLVKLTPYGDANLNGKVDPDDYALLDRSFAQHLPDAHWTDGDFNYDGAVDDSDYLLIDRTLGQAQGFSPDFLSERESQFGATYVENLLTSIPEPSSLACLFAGFSLLARRRTRPRR
jgi:hypothetical protein